MKFEIAHSNINVADMEKSLAFYGEALGMKPVRQRESNDGSYRLSFLSDGRPGSHLLELTWLRDKQGPYDLGENESHIGFLVDDMDAAYKKHKEMGIICFENPDMGIYFINDPDGYWLEIIPAKR